MLDVEFKGGVIEAVERHLEQRIEGLLSMGEDTSKKIHSESEALRGMEGDHALNTVLAQNEATRQRINDFRAARVCAHTFACEKDAVEEGALVEVSELERGRYKETLYFILTGAGGEEVVVADSVVQIISPKSPRAQALLGGKVGDAAQLTGRGEKEGWIMKMVVLSVI